MKTFTSAAILLCIFTCNSISLMATHNRGGEIIYKRISPFTKVVNNVTVTVYHYSITVIKYHNFGSGVANRCTDLVYFGDGDSASANRINGPVCTDCGTISCGEQKTTPSGSPYLLSIYSVEHTYPGPGNYTIRSFDANRNQGVENIPNSVNQPFYIESLLIINSFIGTNHSPVINSPAIANATLNTCFIHYPNAVDPDGDSLSYEISQSRGVGGQTVPGYTYPDAGPGGYYAINAVTGTLGWCNPQQLGDYALAYIVKEWRKNTAGNYTLIGYVLRDMEVKVIFAPVGIEENSAWNDINISPIPTSEKLLVKLNNDFPKELTYSIMTIQGSVVQSAPLPQNKNEVTLDCSPLPPGTYFIKIKGAEGSVVKKFIKL